MSLKSKKIFQILLAGSIALGTVMLIPRGILQNNSPQLQTHYARLSKQLLSHTDSESLTMELAIHLAKSQQWRAAHILYQQLLAAGSTNPSLLNNLAYVVAEMGDVDKAQEYLKKAVEKDPRCAECANNLGSLLFQTGNPELAKPYFEIALVAEPNYADAAVNLAILLESQGQFESAQAWYQRAEIPDENMKKWVTFRMGLLKDLQESIRRNLAGSP